MEHNNVNEFLSEIKGMIPYFSSNTKEHVSVHFKDFFENIFVCFFLYDCINKGVEVHLNSIEFRIKELSKKISREADEIHKNFEELIESRELIAIFAYEFFINYLLDSFRMIYSQNLSFLKSIEQIEYKGHEIIQKIIDNKYSSEFIISDLINLKIFGTKEGSNLKTDPSFWLKLLDEAKINLDQKSKSFLKAFHERRNAASHIDAKKNWKKFAQGVMELVDLRVWLYGLLLLAYRIDKEFCSRFKIDKKDIYMNFTKEPIYKIEKLNI